MKHGVDFPPFEEFADPRFMAELAYEAEQAGWDGVFTWDHVWLGMSEPFVDPWVALSAIAARTEHIRIGAMVTPLSRRRPWQVARTTRIARPPLQRQADLRGGTRQSGRHGVRRVWRGDRQQAPGAKAGRGSRRVGGAVERRAVLL